MAAPDPLVHRAWQPLPGSRGAEIYPFIRKPDLLSSNSCIIRTAEQILLIDPGALEEQAQELLQVMRRCEEEKSRPVLICITHCHIDHVLHASWFREALAGTPAWIAVHEEGAQTLVRGDEKRSIAELYGLPFPPFAPDLLLMTRQDREGSAPREVRLSAAHTLTLTTERLTIHDGRHLYRQRIPIGNGESLFLYQTPGHSPDSLCLQIGEVLFTGDLLTAVGPMVAGIAGWNRDDYLLSVEQILWLFENGGIGLCCPGHGGLLSVPEARGAFRRLLQEARQLGELEEVNQERVLFTAEYALELIDEAEEIFSAIAGRLGYVSYQMDLLEEPEAAAACRTLMDMDGIDACLADFRQRCEELQQGRLLRIKFVLAVLHIVKKIGKQFDRRRLKAVIQPSLLNRADRILIDFIAVGKGVRNPEEFVWTDLEEALRQIVRDLRASPHADEGIIDASERRQDYLAALMARIGYADLFEKTLPEISGIGSVPPVRLAAARFADVLTHLLEFLAVRGAGLISISAGMDRDTPWIRITAPGGTLASGIDEKKGRSFARRFRMSGASSFTIAGNALEIRVHGDETAPP